MLIFPIMLNIALFVTFESMYRYQMKVGPSPLPSFSQLFFCFLIAFHALSVIDVKWKS